MIIDTKKTDQLNKYYEKYDAKQKRWSEIPTIKYIFKFKKYLTNLHESMPEGLYRKLESMRLR